MRTVLRLGFSSRTELEWDFSKRLTQQAGAFSPPILADGVLCEYIACGEGILPFDFEHEQPSGGERTGTCGSGEVASRGGGLNCERGCISEEKRRTEVEKESCRRDAGK